MLSGLAIFTLAELVYDVFFLEPLNLHFGEFSWVFRFDTKLKIN